MTSTPQRSGYARLPFFYGWVIVAVVFITMGVAVNARTAFSLLFPPILDEFGWDRGTTAGAFSFGFIVSAIMSPSLGRLMDKRGPLVVNELGVVLIGSDCCWRRWCRNRGSFTRHSACWWAAAASAWATPARDCSCPTGSSAAAGSR